MELLLSISGGFVIGLLHAFDADHIAALSALTSRQLDPRRSLYAGIRWGIGHTFSLVVFGIGALALHYTFPDSLQRYAEITVGVMLILIGSWVLRGFFTTEHVHYHTHEHDGVLHAHLHTHKHAASHRHEHSVLLVGMVHGFAGTAGVMIVIPMAVGVSLPGVFLYILSFGVGSTLAMGSLAYVWARFLGRLSFSHFLPALQAAIGVAVVGLGMFWIIERFP